MRAELIGGRTVAKSVQLPPHAAQIAALPRGDVLRDDDAGPERVDDIPYMVIKKDGRRERFERQKLIAGMLRACEKRPVTVSALEAIADRIEGVLQDRPEKEISTGEIGVFVMQELKRLDKVAYVRFASVYRDFRDIGEFMVELKDLISAKE